MKAFLSSPAKKSVLAPSDVSAINASDVTATTHVLQYHSILAEITTAPLQVEYATLKKN